MSAIHAPVRVPATATPGPREAQLQAAYRNLRAAIAVALGPVHDRTLHECLRAIDNAAQRFEAQAGVPRGGATLRAARVFAESVGAHAADAEGVARTIHREADAIFQEAAVARAPMTPRRAFVLACERWSRDCATQSPGASAETILTWLKRSRDLDLAMLAEIGDLGRVMTDDVVRCIHVAAEVLGVKVEERFPVARVRLDDLEADQARARAAFDAAQAARSGGTDRAREREARLAARKAVENAFRRLAERDCSLIGAAVAHAKRAQGRAVGYIEAARILECGLSPGGSADEAQVVETANRLRDAAQRASPQDREVALAAVCDARAQRAPWNRRGEEEGAEAIDRYTCGGSGTEFDLHECFLYMDATDLSAIASLARARGTSIVPALPARFGDECRMLRLETEDSKQGRARPIEHLLDVRIARAFETSIDPAAAEVALAPAGGISAAVPVAPKPAAATQVVAQASVAARTAASEAARAAADAARSLDSKRQRAAREEAGPAAKKPRVGAAGSDRSRVRGAAEPDGLQVHPGPPAKKPRVEHEADVLGRVREAADQHAAAMARKVCGAACENDTVHAHALRRLVLYVGSDMSPRDALRTAMPGLQAAFAACAPLGMAFADVHALVAPKLPGMAKLTTGTAARAIESALKEIFRTDAEDVMEAVDAELQEGGSRRDDLSAWMRGIVDRLPEKGEELIRQHLLAKVDEEFSILDDFDLPSADVAPCTTLALGSDALDVVKARHALARDIVFQHLFRNLNTGAIGKHLQDAVDNGTGLKEALDQAVKKVFPQGLPRIDHFMAAPMDLAAKLVKQCKEYPAIWLSDNLADVLYDEYRAAFDKFYTVEDFLEKLEPHYRPLSNSIDEGPLQLSQANSGDLTYSVLYFFDPIGRHALMVLLAAEHARREAGRGMKEVEP